MSAADTLNTHIAQQMRAMQKLRRDIDFELRNLKGATKEEYAKARASLDVAHRHLGEAIEAVEKMGHHLSVGYRKRWE